MTSPVQGGWGGQGCHDAVGLMVGWQEEARNQMSVTLDKLCNHPGWALPGLDLLRLWLVDCWFALQTRRLSGPFTPGTCLIHCSIPGPRSVPGSVYAQFILVEYMNEDSEGK